jgi:hypothetical protein
MDRGRVEVGPQTRMDKVRTMDEGRVGEDHRQEGTEGGLCIGKGRGRTTDRSGQKEDHGLGKRKGRTTREQRQDQEKWRE